MQSSSRFSLGYVAVVAAITCFVPLQAFATLGGNEASIEADRLAMAGTAGTAQAGVNHSVRSFTLPSGTVVREFLATGGSVFGVAWEGPLLPDLRQLLGERHFSALDDSARSRNREGRRGPMELRPTGASTLVIDSTGHMRAFAGRAYLTDQLPSGVETDAIR